MALFKAVLLSPVAAAMLTAAALLLQAWWQRRDSQAHEFRMARERHRADMERIEREAALRVKEAGHERLLGVHQGLLARLDALAMAVSGAITSMYRLKPDDQVQLGARSLAISQDHGALMDAERAVRLFASSEAVDAAGEATAAASVLISSSLFADSPPGMTLAQYSEHYRTFFAAREAYRTALRRDIGSE